MELAMIRIERIEYATEHKFDLIYLGAGGSGFTLEKDVRLNGRPRFEARSVSGPGFTACEARSRVNQSGLTSRLFLDQTLRLNMLTYTL